VVGKNWKKIMVEVEEPQDTSLSTGLNTQYYEFLTKADCVEDGYVSYIYFKSQHSIRVVVPYLSFLISAETTH
jgi:hypothetical protein